MRAVFAILLLFVFAALGWLFLFAAAPEPPADIGPPAGEGPAQAPEPPPPVQASADSIAVLVEIEPRARIVPPLPLPEFEVWRGQQRLQVPVTPVAGAHGGQFESAPGDRTLVRLELGASGSFWRAVTVDTAAPTVLHFGPPCRVSGRVADTAGAPVIGASVWTGATGQDGGLLAVDTDADGAFTVDVMQGGGVPVVVQKTGLASRALWLDLGPAGASQVLVTLEPETVLAVQCVAVADSLRGASIGVLPGASASTGMLQWPFFLQAVQGLAGLDERGQAQLRGLPRDADVQLVVLHPLAMLSPPVAVALRGARTEALAPLRLLPSLRGRVLDAEGQPIEGLLVRCQLRDQPRLPQGRWMLPEELCLSGASLGVTGADGAFSVGCAGQGEVTIRRPGGAALAFAAERAGPLARDLLLPEWVEGPAVLQLPAPGTAAWLVRVKPHLADFAAVAAGQPFAQPLPQPVLADLRLLLRRDGRWSPGKDLRDVAVVGTWTLPAELLR